MIYYRMIGILAAAVKSTTWQGSDGIITEGSDNSKNDDGVGFKGKSYRQSKYMEINTSA